MSEFGQRKENELEAQKAWSVKPFLIKKKVYSVVKSSILK